MNLPYLDLSSMFAQIGLKFQRPPMTIRQPSADMEINQSHSDVLKITNELGELTIDQSEAFASVGAIPPLRLANQFYARALSHSYEVIAKYREEGDRLMKIEDGGNPIAEIAKEDSKLFDHEFRYALAPKPFSVKMHYEPGEFHVEVKQDRIEFKVQKNDPIIRIPKWQVQTYVRQKNQLTIRVVGLNVDRGL